MHLLWLFHLHAEIKQYESTWIFNKESTDAVYDWLSVAKQLQSSANPLVWNFA